ncbi:MAG: hypothetical protein H0U35_01810 [Sporichthyaceae bacterium]|nr:hypothetical protein [Sporichthyaceae bacterium]
MAIPFDVDATWLNTTASYDAGELRRADGALVAGAGGTPWGGIARHSDTAMNVTVNGSDVVTVNPGAVVIPGNAVAETGVYRASLAAAQTGTLSARHATNPRITLVVFRALDTDVVVGHAAYKGRIEFVDGTPGAVPSAPALPNMAVELARITVPQTGGAAASVDLTYRTYATAAGGTLMVPTFARLPASAAKWQQARAIDTGSFYEWNGTAWVALNAWTGAEVPVQGGTVPPAGARQIMAAQSVVTTVGAVSTITVPFGRTFPNGVISVVVSIGDSAGDPGFARVTGVTTSQATCQVYAPNGNGMAQNLPVRVNVIAVGW